MERAGLPVRICAGGSTGSWQIAGTMDGITEISPGTYALMDGDDDETLPRDFNSALRILATVLSRPAPDRAVTDCGNKAIGYGGPPLVADPRGATFQQLYTEHGALHLEGAARHLRPEDRVVLIPRNHGAAATAHHHLVGVRDGRVECVWELKSSDAHH
jgi:D-serine deaminase-like pyridoxal phosphate-dependent protein